MISIGLITIAKFTLYYLLQKYRSTFGGNYRKTIILGKNKQTLALEKFFNNNPEYGYLHQGTFNIKKNRETSLQECFKFIKEEKIDEIYCSISELSNSDMIKVIDFSNHNLKILKFIPDNKDI